MLPKIQQPIFPIDVPSLKTKGRFRQWVTREEKILLVAKESTEPADKLGAIYQIVNNCSIDVDVAEITTADVEWLFLKLRECSVGNEIDVTYHDPEDNKEYPVKIDLTDVEPPKPSAPTKDFLSGDCGFQIRSPKASLYLNVDLINSGFDVDEVAALSLVKVWDKSGKKFDEFTVEEAREFMLGVDSKTMDEVRAFIGETESMLYTVRYTNSIGTERSIKLSSLTDFFML